MSFEASLKARYCRRREKSRSRASKSAPLVLSCSSSRGSRCAAFISRRVAATTRNSVVRDRSGEAFVKAMNSSVTCASATSVMSSLWRAISDRRRSKGPSKTGNETAKSSSSPWISIGLGGVTTGDNFARQPTIRVRPRVVGRIRQNRFRSYRRVRELNSATDASVEDEVTESLL